MSILEPRYDHGTRASYVAGCRCVPCTASNAARHRERHQRMLENAGAVVPTGPPLEGTIVRAGVTHHVKRCPGANGNACVRDAAWLRGPHLVCRACVERETVWDGLVPIERTRKHLLKLRRAGVGYKSVAAACDVSHTSLAEVLAGRGPIRASTERRVLAVDAGARADGALVRAARANRMLADLRERGFTLDHLAELLGHRAGANSPQIGGRTRMTAKTQLRVELLSKRVERGKVQPRRFLVVAHEERALLRGLVQRGVSRAWLSGRLGFKVDEKAPDTRPMRPQNAAAVRAFRADVEQYFRNGDSLPATWLCPDPAVLERAFFRCHVRGEDERVSA